MSEQIYCARQSIIDTILSLEMNSESLKKLFGWNKPTIDNFLNASNIIVTLPHASPNVFFPRVSASWYARHLQQKNERTFHLRIVLSHTNFSDLGWRPYAWWYLDRNQKIRKEVFFTRNKKKKHITVLSQPPLGELPQMNMEAHHRLAYSLATQCTNRAWSYVSIMASTERAAGLSITDYTLYITLDQLLSAITKTACPKVYSLLQQTKGRALNPKGELVSSSQNEAPLVYDNPMNIALISTLGVTGIVGGKKMLSYWPEVAERELAMATGYTPMEIFLIPDNDGVTECLPPSQAVSEQLALLGIPYSQEIALSEYGRFAETYAPF